MEPTVTVVTTCYNAEPFIEEAIRSILNQTFDDLEHIAVDDGSTDGTLRILHEIDDARLHIIAAGRVGRGKALNIGLQKARGRYVAIQDADDVSHPNRLTLQIKAMEGDRQISLLGAESVQFGRHRPLKWPQSSEAGNGRLEDVTSRIIHYNPVPHTSMVSKRQMLEQIGGYDEGRRALYDWDLYIRLVATGVSAFKLAVPLVGKRIHSGQVFEAQERLRYVTECLKLQMRARRDLQRNRLYAVLFPAIMAYRLLPRALRMAFRRLV